MDEIFVKIDAKWHSDRVATHQEWIKHSKESIEWALDMLQTLTEHLQVEEQWLADAVKDQEEFEAQGE